MPKFSINSRDSKLKYRLTVNAVEATLLSAQDHVAALSSLRQNDFIVNDLGVQFRPYVRHIVVQKEKELKMKRILLRKTSKRLPDDSKLSSGVKSALRSLFEQRAQEMTSGGAAVLSGDEAKKELKKRLNKMQSKFTAMGIS